MNLDKSTQTSMLNIEQVKAACDIIEQQLTEESKKLEHLRTNYPNKKPKSDEKTALEIEAVYSNMLSTLDKVHELKTVSSLNYIE